MKIYRGYRQTRRARHSLNGKPIDVRCVVTVEDAGVVRPLKPRLDLCNFSPTGFEWGYGGSGPAQLALALVADCCGQGAALYAWDAVKREIVAGLARDGWMVTEEQVADAVKRAHLEHN